MVNVIAENPFRVLGVPITATEREIVKNVSELTLFAEMGKSEVIVRDFPFFQDAERTAASVGTAQRQIEQPENKLFFSLFWFWQNDETDAQASDQLRHGNIEAAIRLWHANENGTSALKNLGVLYLGLSANAQLSHQDRLNFFLKGISLTGRFLSGPSFGSYVQAILGHGPSPDKTHICRRVADEICHGFKSVPEWERAIRPFLSCFKTFPDEIPPYVTRKLVTPQMQRIESVIAEAREKRSHAPRNADQQGEQLAKTARNDLAYLRNALSSDALQYQMIADKLANEILQCAIDYFNQGTKNTHGHDPGKKALKLANHAASFAVGERIRNRIQENLSAMEAWVRNAPARARQKDIRLLMDDISDQVRRAASKDKDRLKTARQLLDHCMNKLLLIRESPEVSDAVFLKLTNAAADSALKLCMAHARETRAYGETLRVAQQIGTLDMSPELRDTYEDCMEQLNTHQEDEMVRAMHAASGPDEKKGFCYVATMAYGDYHASEVRMLRRFRDEVLARHALGQEFIRCYYTYSPWFVRTFRDTAWVNHAVRLLLDALIAVMVRTGTLPEHRGGQPDR